MSVRRAALSFALGAASLLALAPSSARAQTRTIPQRIELHAGVFGAAMLSGEQRSQGFSSAIGLDARGSFALLGPVSVQAAFSSTLFIREGASAGQLYTVGGGLRLDPSLSRSVRALIEANANAGFTADKLRFAWDAALGATLQVHSLVGLSVYGRLAMVHASAEDLPSDAIVLGGGLALSVRFGDPRPSLDDDALDSDADGVIDREDFCPVESSGSQPDPLRPGCRARLSDQDNDGVLDREDFCPATARGSDADPTRPGCPRSRDVETDTDGDGVADSRDACPTVAGVRGRNPQRNGCPRQYRFSVEGSEDWVTDPVFFDRGDADISPRSRQTLAYVLEALQMMPQLTRVSVQGHADESGTPERNVELSARRAEVVYRWLISQGISAERLSFEGRGDAHPMINERSSRAYAVNRRVEFHILEVSESGPTLQTRAVRRAPPQR
jgi:outer membrane protein OmpA-like peptidoglycan-associated protein